MRNFRMVLAYDGSRYRGWQRLGDSDQTIQGKLEAALSRILQQPIEVSGSGRTDAGAHAAGQVANFHASTDLSSAEICTELRHYLPEDIGVISLSEADPRFHSRLNASRKTYLYRIWNSELPCVFERKYVWSLPEKLDLAAMQEAAQSFLGAHDFMAFCSNKRYKKSTVRTIESFEVFRHDEEIRFLVTGNGFLYNMVRIMVGTLLSIGRHEMTKEAIAEIFEGKVRAAAGETVPARGLCLMEVAYS